MIVIKFNLISHKIVNINWLKCGIDLLDYPGKEYTTVCFAEVEDG